MPGRAPTKHDEGDNQEDEFLHQHQRDSFQYFIHERNPKNGLIRDRTETGAPASITAVGLALASYPIGVESGFISREEAQDLTLRTLRFLHGSPQDGGPNATGYRGFYYHFLDMDTGTRAGNAELSTIDSTFLVAGALTAAHFFDRDDEREHEIRTLGDELYRRMDWQWALNDGQLVSHGWTPEAGFLPYRWEGYSEALLLYLLGLGSPASPLPEESYHAWASTYEWRTEYGIEYLFAGPLFIHQLSHIWVDFRGIHDRYTHEKGVDYFENSRRAAYAQQAYAIDNPSHFRGYDEFAWGITASAGPGNHTLIVDGVQRRFYGYLARGAPGGPDDGTLSPWAVIASLPFAPEITIPTIRNLDTQFPEMVHEYGFRCSVNPTFPGDEGSGQAGWISSGYYGLNQGPIVLMIANYHDQFVWKLMQKCRYLRTGLRRAGFQGGWVGQASLE